MFIWLFTTVPKCVKYTIVIYLLEAIMRNDILSKKKESNERREVGSSIDDMIKAEFGWEVPVTQVPMPSGGLIYGSETGLKNRDYLNIKAMTAREEDMLMSPALRANGTFITEVLKSCVTDQGIDLDDLLLGDRDALMISVRITGYGAAYKSDVTCPNCNKSHQSYPFDLASLGIKSLDIEPIVEGTNEFAFTLPVSNLPVVFKFLTTVDNSNMNIEKKKKQEVFKGSIGNEITDDIFHHVISINGIKDRAKLKLFIERMSSMDSHSLRSFISKYEPGIDMKVPLDCDKCKTTTLMELPLGFSFFWPALEL